MKVNINLLHERTVKRAVDVRATSKFALQALRKQ
jgi:hypothetical protein